MAIESKYYFRLGKHGVYTYATDVKEEARKWASCFPDEEGVIEITPINVDCQPIGPTKSFFVEWWATRSAMAALLEAVEEGAGLGQPLAEKYGVYVALR